MEFCIDYKKIKTESNCGLTGYCECSAACSKCTTSISIIIIFSAIVISIIIIISAIVISIIIIISAIVISIIIIISAIVISIIIIISAIVISIIIIISAIVISIIIIISAIVIVIVIATCIIFVVRVTSFFGNRSSSQRCDWLGDGRKNSGKLSNVRRSTILNGIYQIL